VRRAAPHPAVRAAEERQLAAAREFPQPELAVPQQVAAARPWAVVVAQRRLAVAAMQAALPAAVVAAAVVTAAVVTAVVVVAKLRLQWRAPT
jgi:hypothetical protein